jgi:glycosyltransferase 2 family protein
MKRAFFQFLVVSAALGFTVWLISATSLTAVLNSFIQLGWGIAAIVCVRGTMILINAVAWWRLPVGRRKISFVVFALLRWIRDSIDALLPLASIGGGLVSARLLTFWQISGSTALAGLLVDVFLQTVAQAIFAVIGLFLMARLIGLNSVLPSLIVGLGVIAVVLGGFYAVQRCGAARLIERTLRMFLGPKAPHIQKGEPTLQTAIDDIWHYHHRQLIEALIIHAIAWSVGTMEVWLTLRFMGWPMSLEQSVIMESLGASISSAAFFIPGSWGVQEGGYILIGQLLGVPAPLALGLSMAKRVPDLVQGAPGLMAWRVVEARHLYVHAKAD